MTLLKEKIEASIAWRTTLYIIGYDVVNCFTRSPKKETAFCFGLNRVIGPYLLVCTQVREKINSGRTRPVVNCFFFKFIY